MSKYITKEGRERLQNELRRLSSEERPAIIAAIAEARAHGDLSENAEYHSAKEKQGMIERRIRELEFALASARVFDPAAAGGDGEKRCIFGAFVEVEDSSGGKISYRIVGEYESDINAGLVSVASPLGKALLGKREGEEAVAVVKRPGDDPHDEEAGNRIEYTVISVRYE